MAAQVVALAIIADLGDAGDLPKLRELAAHSDPVYARGRGFGFMPPIDVAPGRADGDRKIDAIEPQFTTSGLAMRLLDRGRRQYIAELTSNCVVRNRRRGWLCSSGRSGDQAQAACFDQRAQNRGSQPRACLGRGISPLGWQSLCLAAWRLGEASACPCSLGGSPIYPPSRRICIRSRPLAVVLAPDSHGVSPRELLPSYLRAFRRSDSATFAG